MAVVLFVLFAVALAVPLLVAAQRTVHMLNDIEKEISHDSNR